MITTQDLRGIAAFAGVDDGAIALAASRSAEIELAAGEWLIHEGEVARFFSILSGTIEITKRVGGQTTMLTTYGAGSSFGEVPLILVSPSISSVRATEPTRLAALDATEFWRLMHTQERVRQSGDRRYVFAASRSLWSTRSPCSARSARSSAIPTRPNAIACATF